MKMGKNKAMNLVITGFAGSGKGTQAKLLAKKYDIPHISMGEIFRDIRKQDTGLGRRVKEIIDNGRLVPDDTTNQIVAERISRPDCEQGFVLDGYPRNLVQAEFLDKQADITKCIYLEVSEEEVIKRLSTRRICPACKTEYNLLYVKPEQDDKCDKCGAELVQRDDDKPDAIRQRLKIFYDKTSKIIDFYDSKGVLLRINGGQPIKKVFEDIVAGLG